MEKIKFFVRKRRRKRNKMVKEFIICVIILVLIFVGNGITQGYSRDSIENINQKLTDLEEVIDKENKEEIDQEEVNKREEEIDKEWDEMFAKLAYYIEHEELEKVAKNLENMKTYLKLKEYDNAIKEIREGIYILQHIEDKYSFNLQNIF